MLVDPSVMDGWMHGRQIPQFFAGTAANRLGLSATEACEGLQVSEWVRRFFCFSVVEVVAVWLDVRFTLQTIPVRRRVIVLTRHATPTHAPTGPSTRQATCSLPTHCVLRRSMSVCWFDGLTCSNSLALPGGGGGGGSGGVGGDDSAATSSSKRDDADQVCEATVVARARICMRACCTEGVRSYT